MVGGTHGMAALPAQPGYDLLASHYDAWHWQTFWEKNEVGLVRKIISQLPKPRRAIDIGTGTGRYLKVLNTGGVNAVGTDISDRMLAKAANKIGKNSALIHADLTRLPLASHVFDLAISCRVLSHVENLSSAFFELSRIIRPGGHLIVSDIDGAHRYKHTKINTPNGKIAITTYKRQRTDVFQQIIQSKSWKMINFLPINALTARWLPESPLFDSIDRTGARPIAYILVMQRTADYEF